MKKLLVVVDMQNDFLTGSLGSQHACAIIPEVKAVIEDCRRAGTDIIFTRDTHEENYMSTQEGKKLPVPHCIRGTDGWQIADGLHQGELVFDKPTFGSVALAEYVREKGYEDVLLIGVCTDICVISNAFLIKAFLPETKVRIKASTCAGVTMESHERALVSAATCQIEIE